MRLGDTIQRLLLIKARHFDRPFDRGAASTDFQTTVVGARDGDNPPVELRGITRIDFQFLLAGAFALLKRRVVKKRQPHRPLDL